MSVPELANADFSLDEARRLYGGHVRGPIFMELDADDQRAESRWVVGIIREGRLFGQIATCRPEANEGFEA